jgi:hypothetical protein
VGTCEHGNEDLSSIQGGEFPSQLRDYQLLKKKSAPWSLLLLRITVTMYIPSHNKMANETHSQVCLEFSVFVSTGT